MPAHTAGATPALYLDAATLAAVRAAAAGEAVAVPPEGFGFYAASLYAALGRLLVVTATPARAEIAASELRTLLPGQPVLHFPDIEVLPYEHARVRHGRQAERLRALRALDEGANAAVVVPAPALLRLFPPLSAYDPHEAVVRRGHEIAFERFVELLSSFGYERREVVEAPGSFAVRGGIVDVFPTGLPRPARLEFFGDLVESIRAFDIESQRSLGELDALVVTRESDTPLDEARLRGAEAALPPAAAARLRADVDAGNSLAPFWPLLFDRLESVGEHVSGWKVLVESRTAVAREVRRREREMRGVFESPIDIPGRYEQYFLSSDDVEERLASWDTVAADGFEPAGITVEPIGRLRGASLSAQLEAVLAGVRVLRVFCGHDADPARVRKSVTRLLGEELPVAVEAVPGYLEKGFLVREARAAFLPASFFLGSRIVLTVSKPVARRRVEEALQARPGDFVVHSKWGVARYEGIVREMREGVEREYIVLAYADGTLRIPVDQVEKLTKYAGDAEAVALDSLGSQDWKKARERARRAARKLAFDLVKVHARRELTRRRPYEVENPWVREFEDTFPFQETPDQAQAVRDVYRDLASDRPMERLVVGDVGFGKTEVAMRAAFVAAASGRQVLVVCPTTVLAEQHFETWSERFASFPVEIAMVSRFLPPARRKAAIERFNAGQVDVLIGTHALFSKDIGVERLGLVVLDEEHLFGVNQKEFFKARKPDVDVLFLSATPIPRTLQLALSGIRDISLIETPPPGRLPVVTHVGEYDEELTRIALENELGRGGQALFTHNRIERLPAIARRIEMLVPGARVAIAHGQMRERDLERAMLGFWRGDYDVLVTTTIVESGLDMPLVNTLIVDGAETLGLAQAYQLRGRIGRSYRQAYAYFFHSSRELPELARKRLQALVELSDLGSGFRLALRDLEIRGAGNILGPEQHGHIARVGVELFLDFLHQEIEALRAGRVRRPPREVRVDVPLSVAVPDSYAGGLRTKYEIYVRASRLSSEEEVRDFLAELRDRFGEPPEAVRNLCWLALARNLAARAGVELIQYRAGTLRLSGPAVSAELVEAAPSLARASYALGSVRVPVDRDAIVAVVLDVLADIIAGAHSGKESLS